LATKKNRLDAKSGQKVPLVMTGFTPPLRYKKGKPQKRKQGSHRHHGGPALNTIFTIRQSFLSEDPESLYDEQTVASWTPRLQMAVMSVDRASGAARPLSAAEVEMARRKPSWLPHYFANPMQDLDYIVIEQIKRNTIVGALMDALTKFILGDGFKPELELIEPSGDDEADGKVIEKNQEIIKDLLEIDRQVSKTDVTGIDVSFKEKIAALITCMNTFNRAALVFGYSESSMEINGRTYKEIPTSVKFAHARDLGMIEADPDTWRLKSVQWRNAFYMVPAKDMIYLWNPMVSGSTRGSWLYGDSMVLPMLDSARTIRKNIGVNFPAMAEVSWAGSAILWVRPRGTTESQKEQEYGDIVSKFVRGAPNVLLENPEDTKVDNLDFNPRVKEFTEMTEMLVKYCLACGGLPHSLFFDEAASNRATMLGKIQLAISVTINPMRSWIGRMIADQWYQRNFKLICEQSGRQELLKKFRVKMVFSDLHIEEWSDRIEAVNKVDQRKPLNDKDYGELAGIENYDQKVVPDAQVIPGGKKGFQFDSGDGKGFRIENTEDKAKDIPQKRRPEALEASVKEPPSNDDVIAGLKIMNMKKQGEILDKIREQV
jgi:hypothetical protein